MNDSTPRAAGGIRPLDIMVALAIAGGIGWALVTRVPRPEPSTFVQSVNLDPLRGIAVQADGRVRSFESHAKTYMGYISGPRRIDGQSNGFTYLDLLFRPDRYENRDVVYVKNQQVRAQIIDAAMDSPTMNTKRAETIFKSGLVSRSLLSEAKVRALLQRLGEDLVRTAKVVDAIQSAVHVMDPQFLGNTLRMVATPAGEAMNSGWWTVEQLVAAPPKSLPRLREALSKGLPSSDLADPEAAIDQEVVKFQTEVREAWSGLAAAWRQEDAAGVNQHVQKIANLLPQVAPELYPSAKQLSMESWYFRNRSMTWVWWLYAAAVAPLLMSVIYGWNGARTVGMGFFTLALLGHTASLGIRWFISGRWPNSNMFEAVHTSAWLGTVVALLLEVFTRRTPVRNLFALGASVMSMLALMAAYFLPALLDSSINNKMAALNDIWLYIHTNMIILSYALIGLGFVTALLTLRHRWCRAWDLGTVPGIRLLVLPVALAIANYSGYRILMHAIDPDHRGMPIVMFFAVLGALVFSMLVLVFEMVEAYFRNKEAGAAERAAPGGAASLILGLGAPQPFVKKAGPTQAEVFDGATMVLIELSFITLWTGIVMGAIWADHSWGRPWGWDPKEVFALNTFIIFLILVHVRLKVRDKGLWTAVLAVAGFEVMMFNWIVVNFIISGLHSYA